MLRSTSACELQLLDSDEEPIQTFHNPHIVRLSGFSSCFLSRSVRAVASKPFRLMLKLLPSFKLHGASGVRIKIAIGHKQQDSSDLSNVQSWWLRKNEIQNEHTFEQMQRWDEEDAEIDPVRLEIPGSDWLVEERSKEAMWQETGVANKGCIAIFIQRGHLSDQAPEEDGFQPTFPPVSYYHKAENGPKVIRPSWVTPLSGIHGRPTIFEIRNLLRSTVDFSAEDTITSASSDDCAESSDQELSQAIAVSRAEAETKGRGPCNSEIKFEREEETFKNTTSYKRTKYHKSQTAVKESKQPSWACPYDDEDQDDDEPLPIKVEPGTEDDHDAAVTNAATQTERSYMSSRITPRKRKAQEAEEAELQRCIRESEAEVALAEAQLRQIEAERRLATIRAANEAEREREK